MKVLSGKSKWLNEESLRLDSSYHLSEGRLARFALSFLPYEIKPLKEFTIDIFTSGRSKRIYTNQENGLHFLGNTDIAKLLPLDSCKYISKKFFKENKAILNSGMILTGRVGVIGDYFLVNELTKSTIASDNVIRIIPNNNIRLGFLLAFLKSKFGKSLTNQHSTGAVQPFITEEMLKSIPIPIFPEEKQKQIHEIIIKASDLRVKGNKSLKISEKSLYSLLSISNEKLNELNSPNEKDIGLSFKVNKSQISTLTIRARNFSFRLSKIKELLEFSSYNKLEELITKPLQRGNWFVRVEVNKKSKNSVQMLNQGDIFDTQPQGKIISKKYIKDLENEITKRNMILVPAIGTLGENEIFSRAQFVYGYLEEKTVSEALLRIYSDETKIDPAYLFLVLSSKLWFRIFRSCVHGTNLLYYIYPMLNEMPVPRLNKEQEKDLGDKVRQAYDNFTTALNLENQAIEMVEKEIESWQK